MTARKSPKRIVKRSVVKNDDNGPLWRSWRHIAAYMYLLICFFDFIGMPVYYEWAHKPLSDLDMIAAIANIASESQVEFMRIMSTEQRWVPLTLAENGLFHLAFGAILGVSAWTRGQERIRHAENGTTDIEDFGDLPEDEFIEEEPALPETPPARSRRRT